MLRVYQQILTILPGVIAVISTGVMLILSAVRKFEREEFQQLTDIPIPEEVTPNIDSQTFENKVMLYGLRIVRVIAVVFELTTISALLSFALYDPGTMFHPDNIKFLALYFGAIGGLVTAFWYTITNVNMKKLLKARFVMMVVLSAIGTGCVVLGIGALVTLTGVNNV